MIAATTIDSSHPMLNSKVIMSFPLRFAATLNRQEHALKTPTVPNQDNDNGSQSLVLLAATSPSEWPRFSRRVWHRPRAAVVNNSAGTHRKALGHKSNSSMKVLSES